jgi:2'-5' RNA ligase
MKKRLFLALPITPGLKPKIASLEKEIEKKFPIKPNWIPLDNLHLTILFLGWEEDENIVKILKILDDYPFGYNHLKKVISAKIKKVDYGPPGRQRMIWLYLERNEVLSEIFSLCEKILVENQIPFLKEEREYLPHINLVRLKIKKNVKLPTIKKELNWSVNFNKLVLFQSILKKPFAEYVPLKEISLAPAVNSSTQWA